MRWGITTGHIFTVHERAKAKQSLKLSSGVEGGETHTEKKRYKLQIWDKENRNGKKKKNCYSRRRKKKRSCDLREYKAITFNLYKTKKLFLAISLFQKLILNKNEQEKYYNEISLKDFIRKKYGKKLKNILREITEKFTYHRDGEYKLKFQNNPK